MCRFDRISGYDIRYDVDFYVNDDLKKFVTLSGDTVNDPAIMNEDDFYEQIYGSSVSTLSVISYNKYIKKQN